MRPLSPTQVSTLRSIAEHGLVVPSVTLDGPYAMAHLDLPVPAHEIVRVSTARRLARHNLIAPQQYTAAPGEVVIEWEITEAGCAFLRGVNEAGELAS
jgi:hypothetical protein